MPLVPSSSILLIIGSIAASVLPLPVGAVMSTLLPLSTLGMASSCIGVGSSYPYLVSISVSLGCRYFCQNSFIHCVSNHGLS